MVGKMTDAKRIKILQKETEKYRRINASLEKETEKLERENKKSELQLRDLNRRTKIAEARARERRAKVNKMKAEGEVWAARYRKARTIFGFGKKSGRKRRNRRR